ncbi:MAG: DUF2924 domain-containing protein [Brevundimonas sp.]|uniref:DUF2924 domain-containing protein n=1 Tax=Brevundimonas sp. TaxID=1871086 RepID=UPI001A275477|nr:DUF2924 domain-containing protein [Brevundimonas sp.]MBJ7446262.1 DUF2924 domain-containing protein [Brevundimonas sp.]
MSDLRETLASLTAMDIEALRAVWRERLGEPPPVRSTDVLRRSLAEALQIEVGGQSVALDNRLSRAASQHRTGKKPRLRTSTFQPGSTLIREWQGVRHEVEVRPDGYVWKDQKHASLSKVARLITGVRWNGPRFFGLRDGVGA